METKRLVNTGAETYLNETLPVLDVGYVRLVDYMGVDETVVAAARQSYDKGLNLDDVSRNGRLIGFLMRERHTSPFEQPELAFEVKAPIFVFREWHRHRMASLNEMSGRYTQLPTEFYHPSQDRVRRQSTTNKQGSGEPVKEGDARMFADRLDEQGKAAFMSYDFHLNTYGVARELARIGLPLSTYSKMVWKADLHNLLHFLKLRMAGNAQYEIRQYADAIANVVAASFPKVWAAFEEHVLHAKTFSRSELEILGKLLDNYVVGPDARKVLDKVKDR